VILTNYEEYRNGMKEAKEFTFENLRNRILNEMLSGAKSNDYCLGFIEMLVASWKEHFRIVEEVEIENQKQLEIRIARYNKKKK
jgi:hypothetical protein